MCQARATAKRTREWAERAVYAVRRRLFAAENASQEERRGRLEAQGWLQEALDRIGGLEASLANLRWELDTTSAAASQCEVKPQLAVGYEARATLLSRLLSMKESDLGAATRKVNSLQCKLFETEAPIKQLKCGLQAALQTFQQTRQELEDSEQLCETLEDYIETLASRINKLEHRLREAEVGSGTTKADFTTNKRAASYTLGTASFGIAFLGLSFYAFGSFYSPRTYSLSSLASERGLPLLSWGRDRCWSAAFASNACRQDQGQPSLTDRWKVDLGYAQRFYQGNNFLARADLAGLRLPR